MSDPQNQNSDKDVIVGKDKKENPGDSTSPESNYYYDDSTGYQIYDDQDANEEQVDSIEDIDS